MQGTANYTDLLKILCCGVDDDPPVCRPTLVAHARGVRYHPADWILDQKGSLHHPRLPNR